MRSGPPFISTPSSSQSALGQENGDLEVGHKPWLLAPFPRRFGATFPTQEEAQRCSWEGAAGDPHVPCVNAGRSGHRQGSHQWPQGYEASLPVGGAGRKSVQSPGARRTSE